MAFKSPLELADSYISEPIQKNLTDKNAQELANAQNKVVRYQKEGGFGPTRTSYYPSETGIKFPERLKYKIGKNQGFSKIYKRKKDGHEFVRFPQSTDLFSTTDDSGKNDLLGVDDETLKRDYDYLRTYLEDQ